MLYFNPRSPHGERRSFHSLLHDFDIHFNPRSPHGERQCSTSMISWAVIFQSTLPARGATNCFCNRPCINAFQSTLPARGATHRRATRRCCSRYFNPRSPHGERLLILSICTPPVVISIHAPRTGSDSIQIARIMYEVISIHAPRTGSDDLLATSVESLAIFQSTLPARGATRGRIFKRFPRKISIHAPRTGSDHLCRSGRSQ